MANIEEPVWRNKQKIGLLMRQLERHAMGEVEMKPSQVTAAQTFLRKVLPDLATTQHAGHDGGKLEVGVFHAIQTAPNGVKSPV
jgi:hypothetical protein